MRLAVILLAVVIAAAVIVGVVGFGVGLMKRSAAGPVPKSTFERVVFVDLDRIIALHPGSSALRTMKSTVAEASDAQTRMEMNIQPVKLDSIGLPTLKARVATPRWALEDRAARKADDALTHLRTEKLDALTARLQATKKTMIDSSESDLLLRAHDLDQEAAGKISEISSKHSQEQISLRVKIGALEAMLGERGAKNVGVNPGVNGEDVRKRLAEAQSELEKIDREVASEMQEVSDAADKTIGDLRASNNAKIDSAIAAYGAQETRTVEEHIQDARNQVMGDVMSLDEIAGSNVSAGPKARVVRDSLVKAQVLRLAAKPVYDAPRGASEWRERELRLEKRVREDVASTVRAMARDSGMKVVFTRQGPSVPDETARFIKLMKDGKWRLGRPVLYGPSDS